MKGRDGSIKEQGKLLMRNSYAVLELCEKARIWVKIFLGKTRATDDLGSSIRIHVSWNVFGATVPRINVLWQKILSWQLC